MAHRGNSKTLTWIAAAILAAGFGWLGMFAAEADNPAPNSDAALEAARRVAEDASREFDRYLKSASKSREERARLSAGDGPGIESSGDWLARTRREYGELIERLSKPTAPNPVEAA
ncbi:MAG: hypothetical protein JSS20_14270, partial [Proteobacteria bacterium]|nr:hypothetical protein [Pseudomonadota bacterium]